MGWRTRSYTVLFYSFITPILNVVHLVTSGNRLLHYLGLCEWNWCTIVSTHPLLFLCDGGVMKQWKMDTVPPDPSSTALKLWWLTSNNHKNEFFLMHVLAGLLGITQSNATLSSRAVIVPYLQQWDIFVEFVWRFSWSVDVDYISSTCTFSTLVSEDLHEVCPYLLLIALNLDLAGFQLWPVLFGFGITWLWLPVCYFWCLAYIYCSFFKFPPHPWVNRIQILTGSWFHGLTVMLEWGNMAQGMNFGDVQFYCL